MLCQVRCRQVPSINLPFFSPFGVLFTKRSSSLFPRSSLPFFCPEAVVLADLAANLSCFSILLVSFLAESTFNDCVQYAENAYKSFRYGFEHQRKTWSFKVEYDSNWDPPSHTTRNINVHVREETRLRRKSKGAVELITLSLTRGILVNGTQCTLASCGSWTEERDLRFSAYASEESD